MHLVFGKQGPGEWLWTNCVWQAHHPRIEPVHGSVTVAVLACPRWLVNCHCGRGFHAVNQVWRTHNSRQRKKTRMVPDRVVEQKPCETCGPVQPPLHICRVRLVNGGRPSSDCGETLCVVCDGCVAGEDQPEQKAREAADRCNVGSGGHRREGPDRTRRAVAHTQPNGLIGVVCGRHWLILTEWT